MSKFLIAASVAALCATQAFAGDDVMANTYGNTIVSTGGMSEVHTHYRADHSFDMVGSMMGMSKTFKGSWALDGKGNLCRTFDGETPPNTANPPTSSAASSSDTPPTPTSQESSSSASAPAASATPANPSATWLRARS